MTPNINDIKTELQVGKATEKEFGSLLTLAVEAKTATARLRPAVEEFIQASIEGQPKPAWGRVLRGIARVDECGGLIIARAWLPDIIKAWNTGHATDQIEYKSPVETTPAAKGERKNFRRRDGKRSLHEPKIEAILPVKDNVTEGSQTRSDIADGPLNLKWPESEAIARAVIDVLGKDAAGAYVYKAEKKVLFSKEGAILLTGTAQAFADEKKKGGIKRSLNELLPGIGEENLEKILSASIGRLTKLHKGGGYMGLDLF